LEKFILFFMHLSFGVLIFRTLKLLININSTFEKKIHTILDLFFFFLLGLDCVTGLRCMRLLQRLAHSGSRTIVCSIHQPSASLLELMDQIYLLAAGRCVYRGSMDGLLPKLSSYQLSCPPYHNPADFGRKIIFLNTKLFSNSDFGFKLWMWPVESMDHRWLAK